LPTDEGGEGRELLVAPQQELRRQRRKGVGADDREAWLWQSRDDRVRARRLVVEDGERQPAHERDAVMAVAGLQSPDREIRRDRVERPDPEVVQLGHDEDVGSGGTDEADHPRAVSIFGGDVHRDDANHARIRGWWDEHGRDARIEGNERRDVPGGDHRGDHEVATAPDHREGHTRDQRDQGQLCRKMAEQLARPARAAERGQHGGGDEQRRQQPRAPAGDLAEAHRCDSLLHQEAP